MSIARLYQPTRTAMQQGKANTSSWVLEFAATSARMIEPLMGWTATDETMTQVRLEFNSKEEGLSYAADAGLMVEVIETSPKTSKVKPKSYSENFSAERVLRWTH